MPPLRLAHHLLLHLNLSPRLSVSDPADFAKSSCFPLALSVETLAPWVEEVEVLQILGSEVVPALLQAVYCWREKPLDGYASERGRAYSRH